MEDHLRFAVAWWHSFAWEGGDPFGGPTFERPWHPQDDMGRAKMKADVAFEMFDLLQVPFFCWHDHLGDRVGIFVKPHEVRLEIPS